MPKALHWEFSSHTNKRKRQLWTTATLCCSTECCSLQRPFVCALFQPLTLSMWWFMPLSTQIKRLERFSRAFHLFLYFAVQGQEGQGHGQQPLQTFHSAQSIPTGSYSIMDDLDWGNTNSAGSSETSSFGLARYHLFTLLALKHGQSSVSKTSLCCNQCSWTVRKEAKHKHRSSLRSEAPRFEGCCSSCSAFSPIHKVVRLFHCFSTSSALMLDPSHWWQVHSM